MQAAGLGAIVGAVLALAWLGWEYGSGVAMKKSRSETVRPGVMPSAHVIPLLLRCADGTRTLSDPWSPTNRYGFSRLTGVVASVV